MGTISPSASHRKCQPDEKCKGNDWSDETKITQETLEQKVLHNFFPHHVNEKRYLAHNDAVSSVGIFLRAVRKTWRNVGGNMRWCLCRSLLSEISRLALRASEINPLSVFALVCFPFPLPVSREVGATPCIVFSHRIKNYSLGRQTPQMWGPFRVSAFKIVTQHLKSFIVLKWNWIRTLVSTLQHESSILRWEQFPTPFGSSLPSGQNRKTKDPRSKGSKKGTER